MVMVGTLLFAFGSCEFHSKFVKEMHIPLIPIQRKTLFATEFCINWATNKMWQTKLLDRRKVTQLSMLHQKSVNVTWPAGATRV